MSDRNGNRRCCHSAKCSPCSECEGSRHHWIEESVDAFDDLDESPCQLSEAAMQVANESGGVLLVCKHCDAWMECEGDDDDDTDLDAEFDNAVTWWKGKP